MKTTADQPPQHRIHRSHFFGSIRGSLFNGRLRQSQVNGISNILNEWEAKYQQHDDRHLAYILATAFHETAMAMQPVEEYGKGRGRAYGKPDPVTKQTYYGRGLVQLTWKANYLKFGTRLNIDLLHRPALALEPGISIEILFTGMLAGLFTGKKLSDYFSPEKEDWVNARRIINGRDRARLIAGYGRRFYEAIAYVPAVPDPPAPTPPLYAHRNTAT